MDRDRPVESDERCPHGAVGGIQAFVNVEPGGFQAVRDQIGRSGAGRQGGGKRVGGIADHQRHTRWGRLAECVVGN